MDETRIQSGVSFGNSQWMNRFYHRRTVPDASFTAVVRPNLDTLYSSAWLDLKESAVVITVPKVPSDRFYIFQALTMWTNVFYTFGTRENGGDAGSYLIYFNDADAKAAVNVTGAMKSPSRYVWLLGRTEILNGEDLQRIHSIQDEYHIFSASAYNTGGNANAVLPEPLPTESDVDFLDSITAEEFYTRAAQVMSEGNLPEPANDLQTNRNLQSLGIQPGKALVWSGLTTSQRMTLQNSLTLGPVSFFIQAENIATVTNGWKALPNNIGNFGTDYLSRAAVAIGGLGANLPVDAVYWTADGLDGTQPMEIVFSSQHPAPPVNAFWSITIYDEQGRLVANDFDRYRLSSNTGLTSCSDGTLKILLQRNAPEVEEQRSNWLPTPSTKYAVTLRMYWPSATIVNGEYKAPVIVKQTNSFCSGSRLRRLVLV